MNNEDLTLDASIITPIDGNVSMPNLLDKYCKAVQNNNDDSDVEECSLGSLDLEKTLSSISNKNDIERKRRRSRPSLIAPKFLPGTLDLFSRAWEAASFNASAIDHQHYENLKNLSEGELQAKVDEAIDTFEDRLLSHAPIIQKNLERKYTNMMELIEKKSQESEAIANEEEAKGERESEEFTPDRQKINQALTEVRESYDKFKSIELKVKDLLEQLELVERYRMERQ